MPSEDILSKPQPGFDERVAYGADASQFIDVRLPRVDGARTDAARTETARPAIGQSNPRQSEPGESGLLRAAVINIHGGYWRTKYDLAHAGHLCEALRGAGLATFNVEYRRVGNAGGGWPGSFEDVRAAYRLVTQQAARFRVDAGRIAVMGHSAGAQLAVCLAAHEERVRSVISLAGVLDLKKAYALHLSDDAVVEFLGGKPDAVPEHYREADPMEVEVARARQWVVVGKDDEVVPPEFSREYVRWKTSGGRRENVELVEIARAGHFELIDPSAAAFARVRRVVVGATG
ncbi:MAG: alpha/beta hydrolase fold domain-containing protein [Terriglobales bacterium]